MLLFYRECKGVSTIYIISPHRHDNGRWNPSSWKTITFLPILHSHYRGCRCPVDGGSQGLSKHDIYHVEPEQFGLNKKTINSNVMYFNFSESAESIASKLECHYYNDTREKYSRAYLKQHLPKRFHHALSPRIEDVIVLTEDERLVTTKYAHYNES